MADKKKPYTSNLQKAVDVLLGAATGLPTAAPALADALTSRLLYDEDVEQHPKDVRSGSVENVIKAMGLKLGTLVSPDMPYLEQYLHPDADVLPKTKPPAGRPGTLPYREPNYPLLPAPDPFHRGMETVVMSNKNEMRPSRQPNIIGLGAYGKVNPETGYPASFTGPQGTINSDELNKSNYIFDIWDFDTPSGMVKDEAGGRTKVGNLASEMAKRVLQQAGKPYAIYGPMEKQ